MTIFGWDLSHYDGPDSRKAIDEGFAFFTHKAGGDSNDAEIASWWNLMKGYRASVLLGAYWVQYPGDPVGRADAFLSRLDATCPGWRDGPFILQVDCEKWGGDPSTMPNRAEIKTFCDRLKSKMPKLRPIVYAPEWAYGESLSGLGYPLWASSYVGGSGSAKSLYPGDASARWGSYSSQVPVILQFTSSATIAGQTTCDANAYRGTLAQLTALAAPGWEQDMSFEDDQVPVKYPSVSADNPTWTGPNALGDARDKAAEALSRVKDLQSVVSVLQSATSSLQSAVNSVLSGQQTSLASILAALSALDNIDEVALADALVPALTTAILAAMPTGTITPEDVETAVRNVLTHGTEGI
jgi:hypothetical protein